MTVDVIPPTLAPRNTLPLGVRKPTCRDAEQTSPAVVRSPSIAKLPDTLKRYLWYNTAWGPCWHGMGPFHICLTSRPVPHRQST